MDQKRAAKWGVVSQYDGVNWEDTLSTSAIDNGSLCFATAKVPMSLLLAAPPQPDRITAYYASGEVVRSRSVGGRVLTGTIDVPALPARLAADWERDIALRLGLEAGDVEELPLARARMRWPTFGPCVEAVMQWTHTLGLQDELAASDIALMACRGARYHHDGAQYGGAAFCNLFLSKDKGMDLHFPATGQRIPLTMGTAVVFDTAQPHAVIERNNQGFHAADFPPVRDCSQIFLTWELSVENANVERALGIEFDVDPATALLLDAGQVWVNGGPAVVCAQTGRWCKPDDL